MARIFSKNFNLLIWGFLISFFIFFPMISRGQEVNQLMLNLIEETPVLPQADLIGIIFRVIQYILMFVGVVALVIIIYGGFLWMTARGNDEQVNKAKKVLINGLIGLIVILLSYAIVSFVIGPLIGGPGQGGGTRPDEPGGPPGLPRGANYLVITNKFPKNDETVAQNTKIVISFNQNLLEESVQLARPLSAIEPTKTSCLDDRGNPTWTVAIQKLNQNNEFEFIDGSLVVVGNSLVFTPIENCPEPLNKFQCEGINGQPCSQSLSENGCCGCFFAQPNYKITLISNRSAAQPGLRGTRRTGNTMHKDEIWNFNVGDYIDAAAPEITKNLPQGNRVARNVGIFVAFNKPIDLTTLKIYNPDCLPGLIDCTRENCGINNCLNYAVNDFNEATFKVYQVDEVGQPVPGGEIKGYFEKFSTQEILFRPSAFCEPPAQDCRCLPSEKNIKIILEGEKIKGANCLGLNCQNNRCDWQFKTSRSVDLDPPTVKRTYPLNKAEEVDRLLEIEAEFQDESGIDPISVNEDTFILWPTILPAKIETDNNVSYFTPSRVLEAAKNYNPVIYGGGKSGQGCVLEPETVFGIKDLAGNTMVGNYLWSFKTGWLVNNGDPYIDRLSPKEGPKGECVTVHGYNLGCCAPFLCSNDQEAKNKIWTNQTKTCRQTTSAGQAQFYIGDLAGVPQYGPAQVLSWREINKPDKCLFGKCPNNCSLVTCPQSCEQGCRFCSGESSSCGECWCPMPPRYSPENEIIVVVPDEAINRLDRPGQVKVAPAY